MTNYKKEYSSFAPKKTSFKHYKRKPISRHASSVSKRSSNTTLIREYPNIFEIFRFFGTLPSPPHVQVPAIPPPPKDSSKKYTLVLDMDETLIHCEHIFDDDGDDASMNTQEDSFLINVKFSKQNVKRVLVKKRPYLDYFLHEVSKHWEVVVFTASHPTCARPILNTLDPDRTKIHHRLYRDACYIASNHIGSHYYIKNLNVLGRDLNSTLLVDNSFEAFGFQINNGLLIKTWKEDPHDNELLSVLKDLQTISENHMTVPEFIQKNYDYSNIMML